MHYITQFFTTDDWWYRAEDVCSPLSSLYKESLDPVASVGKSPDDGHSTTGKVS